MSSKASKKDGTQKRGVEVRGPDGYENWRAALAGVPRRFAYEVNLYTDAWITGHVADGMLGPYSFLNTVPVGRQGTMVHAVTMRVQLHAPNEVPPMDQTDVSRYHGGVLADELASLASLLMGCRLRPGSVSRMFYDDDPLGRPQADLEHPVFIGPNISHQWRVPRARGQHNLNKSFKGLLDAYPKLLPTQAIALVRASRLYQDAIWVAETQPELAWLFLVAALEALAVQHQVETMQAVELMRLSLPKLAKDLESRGSQELLESVAQHLKRLVRATGRFVDFVLQHLPNEPTDRPPNPINKIDWGPSSLKLSLAKIYDYRSRALHDGTPFPRPMSDYPEMAGMYQEVPIYEASASHGAVWVSSDIPMLLHVFEYIARGAIINWWRSIVPTCASGEAPLKTSDEPSQDHARGA